MKCVQCGGLTRVENVVADKGQRRRACRKCGHKFHTKEVAIETPQHGGDRKSEGRLRLWTPLS